MDITEIVKRNNFALAQYEPGGVLRCTKWQFSDNWVTQMKLD